MATLRPSTYPVSRETLAEGPHPAREGHGGLGAEISDYRQRRLLRAGRKRPSEGRRATEQSHEIAPPELIDLHRIASSLAPRRKISERGRSVSGG